MSTLDLITNPQPVAKVPLSSQLTMKLVANPQLMAKLNAKLNAKVNANSQLIAKVSANPHSTAKLSVNPQLNAKLSVNPQLNAKLSANPQLTTKLSTNSQLMATLTSNPHVMGELNASAQFVAKLTYFSNEELENTLRRKATAERQLTMEVIELLEEVDRRKLHIARGFSSLLEYCVRELKYSESSAYRRISAMRVVRDVPEVKSALQEGSLNLNTVAQAQNFFKSEEKQQNKMSLEQKKDILRELHGKSARQTERLLAEISPTSAPVKNETVRAVKDERTQVTLVLSKELTEKIEKLKNHLSHRVPSGRYLDLLEYLVDGSLEKFEGPQKKNMSIENPKNCSAVKIEEEVATGGGADNKDMIVDTKDPRREATPAPVLTNSVNVTKLRSRYISMPVRRLVWQKAQGRCSHVNRETGQRCEQRKFLEIDHIHAHAKGGANTVDNLQLLCDAHNRWKR